MTDDERRRRMDKSFVPLRLGSDIAASVFTKPDRLVITNNANGQQVEIPAEAGPALLLWLLHYVGFEDEDYGAMAKAACDKLAAEDMLDDDRVPVTHESDAVRGQRLTRLHAEVHKLIVAALREAVEGKTRARREGDR